MHSYRPDSPGSPGETLFKYIRSGPEGARGVSDDLKSPFFTHLLHSPSFEVTLLHSPSSLTLGCLWSGCLRNSLYRTEGRPGPPGAGTGPDLRFLMSFSHRFFEGFFFILTSFLDNLLKVFAYFYHIFFETFFGI